MDTYNLFVKLWILTAFIIAIVLLKIPAPYGRFTKRGFGPILGSTLAWVLMEIPSFIIPLYFVFRYPQRFTPFSLFLVFLWIIHYGYRSLIYPFVARKGKDMPLSIVAFGFLFNVINSLINVLALTFYSTKTFEAKLNFRIILGLFLFIFGFYLHVTSDAVLRKLKREREGYTIPYGGFFELVSCPNYLGEIVEWIGWTLLSWNLAGLSFALWTIANLVPRAISHHRWYLNAFPDYPRKRKALIPFLI